ncbi:MAG: hypothetical protein EOM74_00040 [Methanomicrobia archaeon]|nr:hypothetical protein [Methanomicrobia archaeon]
MSTTVNHGASFTFVFYLWESHSQSTPIITVNGGQVTIDENDEYTISNITENKTIVVSGISINKYSVSIPTTQEGYSLSVTDETESTFEVEHDESRTLVFSLLASHSQSAARVLVNDVEVAFVENQYTIASIHEDIIVSVADVNLNSYVITWDIDGVTSTSNVDHGVVPEYVGTPSKEATSTYIYEFLGWSPTLVAATQNTTYTAQFEAKAVIITAATPDESAGEIAAEISVPEGIDGDAHLKVKILQSSSGSIVVPEGKEIFKLYNASLLDDENEVINDQVSGDVTLRFAKPEGLDEREGAQIVLNGIDTPISVTIDEQYVTFTAASLGDFALVVDVVDGTNPAVGLAIGLSVGAALLLAGIALTIYFLNKKKTIEKTK